MNTCLITGAARRLGSYFAIGFAKKGWNIILHYNESDPSKVINEIKQTGVEVFPVRFNLQNYDEIINGFELIKQEFHLPNVLINNAAIFPDQKSILDTTVEEWDRVINTNLRSVFLTSKEFCNFAENGSRIINIASEGAHKIWKERISYNVSKSALITLTKALARELAPRISVNSISPGYVQFENDDQDNIIPQERIPMQRYSTPDDIFQIVYFLASSTEYLTGQDIVVDGGLGLF